MLEVPTWPSEHIQKRLPEALTRPPPGCPSPETPQGNPHLAPPTSLSYCRSATELRRGKLRGDSVKSEELSETRTGHWALNATREDASYVGELANYLED